MGQKYFEFERNLIIEQRADCYQNAYIHHLQPYSSNTGLALVITICCYVLFISLLCTHYSYKGRRLPDNFNEAKYIGFSMYILLLSALLYFPVEFALEGWYVNIVACISILVTSFGFLGCMFGPKLYIILCQPEQNTEGALSCQISRFTFGHNLTPASVRRTQLSLYTPGGGLQKELHIST